MVPQHTDTELQREACVLDLFVSTRSLSVIEPLNHEVPSKVVTWA